LSSFFAGDSDWLSGKFSLISTVLFGDEIDLLLTSRLAAFAPAGLLGVNDCFLSEGTMSSSIMFASVLKESFPTSGFLSAFSKFYTVFLAKAGSLTGKTIFGGDEFLVRGDFPAGG
jgi:hypothetical protein